MNLGWPQIAYACLILLGLGMELARDGEQKKGKHSFWTMAASVALILWLQYMGGFWT